MLGNSSNKHSEVLPKRGSRTLVFVRLVLKIKTNKQKTPTSGKCLSALDTLATNARYPWSSEEDLGNQWRG